MRLLPSRVLALLGAPRGGMFALFLDAYIRLDRKYVVRETMLARTSTP